MPAISGCVSSPPSDPLTDVAGTYSGMLRLPSQARTSSTLATQAAGLVPEGTVRPDDVLNLLIGEETLRLFAGHRVDGVDGPPEQHGRPPEVGLELLLGDAVMVSPSRRVRHDPVSWCGIADYRSSAYRGWSSR